MTYVYVFIPIGSFILGSLGGYFLGRYQDSLIDKIRTLEQVPVEEPAVTAGVLAPVKGINEDDRPIGIAEAKTPQRVEWEATEKIEKEGRGIS